MLTLTAMNAPHRLTPEAHMLLITSTECRAIAEKKLAEAGRDERHRRRLTKAAKDGFLSLVN